MFSIAFGASLLHPWSNGAYVCGSVGVQLNMSGLIDTSRIRGTVFNVAGIVFASLNRAACGECVNGI